MHTIEFETQAHNGILQIPDQYLTWKNKTVKVILLDAETEQLIKPITENTVRSNASKTNEPKEQLDDDSNQESKWAKLARKRAKENLLNLGDYTEQFNKDRQEFRENFEFKHDL